MIGYGISLLLLVLSSVASYVSIEGLLRNQERVNHTNEIINKLDSVMSVLKDAETGQRGFLLTNNEDFLQPYNGALGKAAVLLNKVKQATNDNAEQKVDCIMLESVVNNRLSMLKMLIDKRRRSELIPDSMLVAGKGYMDQARTLIKRMQDREKQLLAARTENLNKFINLTPTLIVAASILGILVTIISFFRVLSDYNHRASLQHSLELKDIEISKRLAAIEAIANQISTGDYALKVDDAGKDALGSIAGSLNKMAQSLDTSFTELRNREWMQTGVAHLNELMIGEKDLEVLTFKVISFLNTYTNSTTAAFYLTKDDETLQLSNGIALNREKTKQQLSFGEGIAGAVAQTQQSVLLHDITDGQLLIDFSGGSLKPQSILAFPVLYETRLKGVIELASMNNYPPITQEFLKAASFNIGMAIHSAKDHARLQELLAETQAQSEELQSQHSELENVNAELEAQAEKLQASEEELRVQQEELQQANQELEERSRLLEEKNELILERNLAIQQKAEELAITTKYKSEFLANMSHELRTPLNSILLLSRLLSENHEKNLSTDQIEYANVIQNSGKGLLVLIDEILDLSKIESGKMELDYSDVKVETIANEMKSMFELMAKEKGVDFLVEVKTGTPSVIETDKLRLEQILRNLISNALKFTKRGSVKLIFARQENEIAFTVKDTGIGIPKEKHQTIFEAFQQADGSTRRQFGGTGLGLSISRELARLLGGEIKLQSEEGKGSEFTLIIPMQKMAAVEIPVAPALPVPRPQVREENKFISSVIPASIPDDRDNIQQGDKSILIIEDDTAFAKSLLDYTRNKGYKGVVAVRGDEGVELARRFRPIGILLDVQLPVKSGWEVMEELKADKETRPIPVHMMSSHEVKTKSLSKGAVDFINKPVAFEKLGEMFQKIEQALSHHPKKVLIVEENTKHAQALAYFLENYQVNAEIKNTVGEGIKALNTTEVDCVILDMGIPAQRSYEVLENVKKTPGMENLPIIVFTGKNLSHVEEMKLKQYADSIVIKTAQSYQRIIDEVSLFLHLVEENKKTEKSTRYKKMGELSEVLKGKTILIADDDVRNIFSLTKSLESYGMNVLSAIDGKDALKQLEENSKVDLVLMDMMMPEMDGYESTATIRQNPKYKRLPIIAVTAKAMTGDREKCIAAGASDYITKPVDVDQLMSLLRVWLYEG